MICPECSKLTWLVWIAAAVLAANVIQIMLMLVK
jgi:hypothetical protein